MLLEVKIVMMKTKFIGKLTNRLNLIPTVMTIAVFVVVAGSCSTNNQLHTGTKNSVKLHDSVLVDNDGNR